LTLSRRVVVLDESVDELNASVVVANEVFAVRVRRPELGQDRQVPVGQRPEVVRNLADGEAVD
jgi:hypothetical protein